ncbi:MAG: hypothetical protein F6K09_05040 [Merismopedia sp. SIO2A8]|nr:hypothetical protein [Merismopedia sp. SIO2A8]
MLQPVQPPAAPQIVQFVNPEDSASEDKVLQEALFSLKAGNISTQLKPTATLPETLAVESSLVKNRIKNHASIGTLWSYRMRQEPRNKGAFGSLECQTTPNGSHG